MAASPPNPISQGFRAARRDLPLFLLEVVWRWSFAIVAAVSLFLVGSIILAQLQISDVLFSAWRTQNYRLMAVAGISILIKPLATLLRVFFELLALALALGIVWALFAASARRIIVRRLGFTAHPLGFRAMLAVQWMRALVTQIALLLLLVSAVAAVYHATKGSSTDVNLFYTIVAPSVAIIAVIWLALNWRLSMAAIFGREGQGLFAALRQSRFIVRRHRSDFAGIAFIFLLLRLVLLLIAVAIIGLTSSMLASAPQSYVALVIVVVLAYCIIADFLYIARMAACMALGAAPDPIAAEMGIVDPELPVEKS